MIWMMNKELFPTEKQAQEILEYKDLNGFVWKIGRVEVMSIFQSRILNLKPFRSS